MTSRFVPVALAVVSIGAAQLSAQRTSDGRPDLQGVWTNGTLTPLTRPAEFANRFSLNETEAAEFERTGFERVIKQVPEGDRVTAGDLSDVYLDTTTLRVVPDRRTSLIVDPPNGNGSATQSATGRVTHSSSTRRTSPTRRTTGDRARGSTWWSGLRAPTPQRFAIAPP